ncbi:serine hydrolase [Undibacterium sp. JH2W]|uniref:serine hydrolase n=1 Tax=Undibacterium sp. JH2W TaxID=3413037 RepID=UPI003BF02975
MKKIFVPFACLSLLCLTMQAMAEDAATVDALNVRISRIENGLLPQTVIKGRPLQPMRLAERMAALKVPGLSIAIIHQGKLEWARGYGYADAVSKQPVTVETRFQAASISKPVTAMAALALVERGSLNLDGDVNQQLLSWKLPGNAFTDKQVVSLRGLLNHTAGINVHGFPGYAASQDVPSLVDVLEGKKPANSAAVRVTALPGSAWSYSGGGYSIVQLLMTDASHESFPVLMKKTVLDKLGMEHSSFELPENWQSMAASGHLANGKPVPGKWHRYPEMAAASLWTTPSDLALFAIEIQQSSVGKSNKVLSPEMARKMLTPSKLKDYGLGVFLSPVTDKQAGFGHSGSNEGYRTMLTTFTSTGQGAALMTNSENGSELIQEVLRAISMEYGWTDYKVVEKIARAGDANEYKSLAGEYVLAGYPVIITAEADRLYVKAAPLGGDQQELFAALDGSFFMLNNTVSLRFEKDANGDVSALVVERGGKSIGKKIK